MGRFKPDRNRHRPGPPPPTRRPEQNALKPQAAGSLDRYAAPGDGPVVFNAPLTLQQPFHFDGNLARQIERRQVNVKEAFTLRDPTGHYFRASLKEFSPAGGMAVPYEQMPRSPEPAIDLTLACAVLARQRMIFIMQKAAELGATRIVPLLTEFSVPIEGLEHERANAWPAQVIRAVKQCRRSSVPEVVRSTGLDAFMQSPAFIDADARVMLDDRVDPNPVPVTSPKRVVLLVGPEGGFSDVERTKLAEHTRPWFLGGRILRAETAVLVGMTAVHMTWGDFGGDQHL